MKRNAAVVGGEPLLCRRFEFLFEVFCEFGLCIFRHVARPYYIQSVLRHCDMIGLNRDRLRYGGLLNDRRQLLFSAWPCVPAHEHQKDGERQYADYGDGFAVDSFHIIAGQRSYRYFTWVVLSSINSSS